jgi:hypothetical protein
MKTLRLLAVIATLIMSLFVLATASFADGGASDEAKAPAIIEANDTLGAPTGAEAGCGSVCPDLYLQPPYFLPNGMLSIWVQNKGNANAGGFWIRVRRMSDLTLLNQVWVPSLTKGQAVNKITFPGPNEKCVKVYVDPFNQVKELNENNNILGMCKF